jgi:hypothetical protein
MSGKRRKSHFDAQGKHQHNLLDFVVITRSGGDARDPVQSCIGSLFCVFDTFRWHKPDAFVQQPQKLRAFSRRQYAWRSEQGPCRDETVKDPRSLKESHDLVYWVGHS